MIVELIDIDLFPSDERQSQKKIRLASPAVNTMKFSFSYLYNRRFYENAIVVAITVNQHQTREPNWLAISPRFLSPAFANYFVYTFVSYNHAGFQSATLLPRAIVSILIYVNIFLYCQQLQEINIWRFSRTRVWTSAAAIESAMIWSLISIYNSSGHWAGCN